MEVLTGIIGLISSPVSHATSKSCKETLCRMPDASDKIKYFCGETASYCIIATLICIEAPNFVLL